MRFQARAPQRFSPSTHTESRSAIHVTIRHVHKRDSVYVMEGENVVLGLEIASLRETSQSNKKKKKLAYAFDTKI